MDAPGGAREPRFGSPYSMGILGEMPDMYGTGRPPSALGGGGLRPGMQPCPMPRAGVKRPSDQCYDERAQQGVGLEHCPMPDIADDGYASLQPKKSPPSNGKKTKGRVKIKMEYIDNKLRRYTTFSKRKTGIMKKAYELSTLTGTQVMLLVASETGHVYTFATRKLQPMITSDSGKRLIQTCLNSPDPPTTSEQRMAATGYEETELTYNVVDEDMKDLESTIKRKIAKVFGNHDEGRSRPNPLNDPQLTRCNKLSGPEQKTNKLENSHQDEPASSGDSGDESGSEPESPSEKLLQVHKQEWTCDSNEREAKNRESHNDALASTSSTTQEADSSKPSLPKLMPKIEQMPGGAMLYPGVLAGLDGISSNLGLGNLAMGYPHGFILGLANQGQEGASSSSQPQFITIPLSMAMAAAAGAPTATVTNGCGASASSDDSSELQDLSTGRK
ncbi:serum response factor homolog isoform X1 [Spodoptera frugiperda]|uniref:Serum response factor homolog n=1 Tax=Spodoptera frugiperda TaxID=7108 RepID=A0A9R0DF90_SPOFR|nr:serum response factor homolog isoform X1 [Spodoptera frugiperda]